MSDQEQPKPKSTVRRIAGIVTALAALVLVLILAFSIFERVEKGNRAREGLARIDAEREAREAADPSSPTQSAPATSMAPSGALRISVSEILRRYEANRRDAEQFLGQQPIEVSGELASSTTMSQTSVPLVAVSEDGGLLTFATGDVRTSATAAVVADQRARSAQLAAGATVTLLCQSITFVEADYGSARLASCAIVGN